MKNGYALVSFTFSMLYLRLSELQIKERQTVDLL